MNVGSKSRRKGTYKKNFDRRNARESARKVNKRYPKRAECIAHSSATTKLKDNYFVNFEYSCLSKITAAQIKYPTEKSLLISVEIVKLK